jgi:hypothetical protein
MKAGANDPVKIASLGIEAFERDFAVLGASSPPEQAGTARLPVSEASRLTLSRCAAPRSKPGRLAYFTARTRRGSAVDL